MVPSEAEEVVHESLSGGEVAQINAYRKARIIAKKFPDAVTMGVDTVVSLENRTFGNGWAEMPLPSNSAAAHKLRLFMSFFPYARLRGGS